MAKKLGGLGKGLNAIFIENDSETEGGTVTLKISEIEPNRTQPRKEFDEQALSELAESISQHGLLQPLLVRPLTLGGYQIVAGERRYRASRMAGLTEVPVIIKELTDTETMEIALIENLQREDLSPVEEALGYKALIDEHGFSQEEVAKSVGKSRPAVANALRLLKLPDNIMEYLKDGKISAGHARALLTLENEELMTELADEIVAKDLSVRQVEKICKKKPTVQKEEKPEKKPSFYSMVELALSESLGRKISVSKSKGKQGGVLQIEFYIKRYFKMIDIKFLRENPDAVKENIKKKFQDYKLPLVDQVIELDEQSRAVKKQADELRSNRNKISKQIGSLMAQGKKEEGMALKEEVTKQAQQLAELEKLMGAPFSK